MSQAREPDDRRLDRPLRSIDELKVKMNWRFDAQDAKIDNLSTELNEKIDIILRHITG